MIGLPPWREQTSTTLDSLPLEHTAAGRTERRAVVAKKFLLPSAPCYGGLFATCGNAPVRIAHLRACVAYTLQPRGYPQRRGYKLDGHICGSWLLAVHLEQQRLCTTNRHLPSPRVRDRRVIQMPSVVHARQKRQ